MGRPPPWLHALAVMLIAALVSGCSFWSRPPPTPAAGTPSGPPAAARPPAPATCPPEVDRAALPVLATIGGDVDDLFAEPDGTLWVSDRRGRVLAIAPGGGVASSIDDGAGPEGIVALSDRTVVLVEQDRDRLVALVPGDPGRTRVLAAVPASPRRHHLDGIALDAARGRLLIADTDGGAVRAMPLAGGALTTVASGLDRPVGVAVGAGGELYIAQRAPIGLVQVPAAGGAAVPLGSFSGLDEVVATPTMLYIAATDHTLSAVTPGGGKPRVMVRGVDAEGLALLPGNRLAVGDAATGTILGLPVCSPPAGGQTSER